MGKIKHRYLWVSPRGFSNEYSVYRVRPDQVADVESWLNDLDLARCAVSWISRDEARPLESVRGWDRPRLPSYDDYGPM